MKRFILFLLFGLILGCNNNTPYMALSENLELRQQYDIITEDPLFQSILQKSVDIYFNIIKNGDKEKVLLYENFDTFTSESLEQYSKDLGFMDYNNYRTFFDEFNNDLDSLLQKYPNQNLEQKITSEINDGLLTFDEIIFDDGVIFEDGNESGMSCRAAYQNCIASAASQATVMHLGCAALDLGVISGIACHGAAIVYQISEGNECKGSYDRCQD